MTPEPVLRSWLSSDLSSPLTAVGQRIAEREDLHDRGRDLFAERLQRVADCREIAVPIAGATACAAV